VFSDGKSRQCLREREIKEKRSTTSRREWLDLVGITSNYWP